MNEEMNDPGKKRAAPVEETRRMDGCNNVHRQRSARTCPLAKPGQLKNHLH